jgi:hypothetical protein
VSFGHWDEATPWISSKRYGKSSGGSFTAQSHTASSIARQLIVGTSSWHRLVALLAALPGSGCPLVTHQDTRSGADVEALLVHLAFLTTPSDGSIVD